MKSFLARDFCRSCLLLEEAKNQTSPLEVVVRQKLRAWTEEVGQNVAARIVGISPQYLNDIIRDRRPISSSFLSSVKEKVIA